MGTITTTNTGIATLQERIDKTLKQHPTLRSTTACPRSVRSSAPGCSASPETTAPAGPILRAAAPTPEAPPITRESGKKRLVPTRFIRDRRLHDAVRCWVFAAPSASPGARAYYDQRQAAGDGHEAALRRLASKLIGQLHHCLADRANPPAGRSPHCPGDDLAVAAGSVHRQLCGHEHERGYRLDRQEPGKISMR